MPFKLLERGDMKGKQEWSEMVCSSSRLPRVFRSPVDSGFWFFLNKKKDRRRRRIR